MDSSNTVELDSPELLINRELSWLEFNDRVLQEGRSDSVPLMERLKFLAIVCSNLDEFFMIRVAGLKQQVDAGITKKDPSGLTPGEQLAAISARAHRMMDEHADAVRDVFSALARHGLRLLSVEQANPEQQRFLESYFRDEVLPVLTPLAVEELEPFPVLPPLGLNLALVLTPAPPAGRESKIALVPVPGNLPRFIAVPSESDLRLVPLEQVMARNIGQLFPDYRIAVQAVCRLTRDADVAITEDEAGDLLETVERAVLDRRRRSVVRLEISTGADSDLREWLMGWCDVDEADVYETDGLVDGTALMSVATRKGFDELRNPPWPAQRPADLVGRDDIWQALQERDILLFHPYESFEPVVTLVSEAADDPSVLAIKQTLYRTSGDSPIVAALARAAENGKQVTVLVELKARFDEAQNVNWARRLEDAGCHVIYGIAGLKTHAKLLLVVRREAHGIRRYVHLSTGNYNDRTARLYADIGLMTTDTDFALDAAAFANLLTGYSQQVGWLKFAISPTGLRRRFIELIEREADAATLDHPGLIMAKVNSLQDKGICRALYRAARSGVRILLNVRGICCLRPGIEDVSDNVRVVSIIDRYLEHARVFYFQNGGYEEVYLSSADWMGRNLDRRLEIMFPVLDQRLVKRIMSMMRTFFADNVKAWELEPDGTYRRVRGTGPEIRAQQRLYETAVEAASAQHDAAVRFRPLTNPQLPRR